MKAFLVNEDGPTATEYAVMLALIIVICLVAIGTLGRTANGIFETTNTALQTEAAGGS
jgi:pilus assembly protein Flp/PilA